MTSSAKAVINASYNMLYDAKSCRRLIITSCRGHGVVPPNTLETMRAYSGRFGDALVVMAGYDDWYNFGGAVDAIVAEARAPGRRATSSGSPTAPRGRTSASAAPTRRRTAPSTPSCGSKVRQHPELVIADWDAYTVGQSSWFAADGIHISATGAMALAGFIKAQLDAPRPPALLRRLGWHADARPARVPVGAGAPRRGTAPRRPGVLDTRAGRRPRERAPRRRPHGRAAAGRQRTGAGRDDERAGQHHRGECLPRRGFLTAYPCGPSGAERLEPQRAGPKRTRAAMATVMLDAQGQLCVYSSVTDRPDRRHPRHVRWGRRAVDQPDRPGPLPRHPQRHRRPRQACRQGRRHALAVTDRPASGSVPAGGQGRARERHRRRPRRRRLRHGPPVRCRAGLVEPQLPRRPDRWPTSPSTALDGLRPGLLHVERRRPTSSSTSWAGSAQRRLRLAATDTAAARGHPRRHRRRLGPVGANGAIAFPVPGARHAGHGHRGGHRGARLPDGLPLRRRGRPPRTSTTSTGDVVANLVALPPGQGGNGCIYTYADRPHPRRPGRPSSCPEAGRGPAERQAACPCAGGRGPRPSRARRPARPSPGAGRPCGGPSPAPAPPSPARP